MNQQVHIPLCNYTIDGDLITIEQDSMGGGIYTVAIHRSHVAIIAKELGLLGNGATLKRLVAAVHSAKEKAEYVATQMREAYAEAEVENIQPEEEAVSVLLAYLDGVISMLPEYQ